MRRIFVNSEKHGRKYIIVDDADYEVMSKFKWSVYAGHTTFYALTAVRSGNKKTTIAIHRLILNAQKGESVDHKDHNGLNNRRQNIRICTSAENSKNMMKHKDNANGFKGVSYDKRRNNYNSRIRVNNKTVHLGEFSTKEAAAHAYNRAAIEHFKEFANLNQIKNDRRNKTRTKPFN